MMISGAKKLRRRSKRVISGYLAFVTLFLAVFSAFMKPIEVWAMTIIDDNLPGQTLDTINADEIMQNNWGIVLINQGTIVNNMGYAGCLPPDSQSVPQNLDGGEITNNYGTAYSATVTNNYGEVYGNGTNVTNNYASGTVGRDGDTDIHVNTNYHGTGANANGGLAAGVTLDASDEWNVGPNYVPPVYGTPASTPTEDNSEQTDNSVNPSAPTPAAESGNSGNREYTQAAIIDSLDNAIKSAGSGESVTIEMGNVNNFSGDLLAKIAVANDAGVSVDMKMNINGRVCTFSVPSSADLRLIQLFYDTFGSNCEGYNLILNLIPGASLSYVDDYGNTKVIVNTISEAEIQAAAAKAKKIVDSINPDNGLPAGVTYDTGDNALIVDGIEMPMNNSFIDFSGSSAAAAEGIGTVGTNASIGVRAENPADQIISSRDSKIVNKPVAKKTIANKSSKKGTKIADPIVPLADMPFEDSTRMNWWWLLIIFLLGATGRRMYEEHKKKQAEAAQQRIANNY